MRVYLDEQPPFHLAQELAARGFHFVQALGGKGFEQEEFLRGTASERNAVFVTPDEQTASKFNLADRGFAVVLLNAAGTDFDDLLPLLPELMSALSSARPGMVVRVAS